MSGQNTTSEIDSKMGENDGTTTSQGNKKTTSAWSRGNTKGQISSVTYGFEGAKAEIGAVLGLKHEKMKLKAMFDDFIEKLTTYLTSNMTGARDVVKTIIDRDDVMARIDLDEAVDLTEEEEKSTVKVLLKTEEVKKFGARKQQARDNTVKVFGLLWGQCSAGLQTSIKGEAGYEAALDTHDLIWLLDAVQKVVSGVDTKASKLYVEQEALVAFTTMRQGSTESTDGFIARVKHNAQTLRLAGGERYLCDRSAMRNPTALDVEQAIEEYLAMHVIRRSDSTRFGELQKSLLDGSHRGRDEYPVTLQEVYALLVRQPKEAQINNRRTAARANQTNVMFAMVKGEKDVDVDNGDENVMTGTDGKIVDAECYICHHRGHISWYCPEAGNTGPPPREAKNLNCAQVGLMQRSTENLDCESEKVQQNSVINPEWILLDTCSTASACCNANLVRDIRKYNDGEELTIITNGGSLTFRHLAVLKDFPLGEYNLVQRYCQHPWGVDYDGFQQGKSPYCEDGNR